MKKFFKNLLRNCWSEFGNIFFSETAGQNLELFHKIFPCVTLFKNCSRNFDLLKNMAAMGGGFFLLCGLKEILQNSSPLKPLVPRAGGSVVSVSDSRPGGCEFNPGLSRLFFLVYFRLSPLQKHVRKVVGGFGKKSCVSTEVRKPGNTYASMTAII